MLAERYRLVECVHTGANGAIWRAEDRTTDGQVSVRVIRPGHRFTADAVDAARRAALVEDPRLIRVTDVGDADGEAFVVTAHAPGRTLEQILLTGALPAETVRRLIGEAAEALDRAGARGLHHLRLSPAHLVITSGGSVTVLGTAVEAALAGTERDDDPLGAARADALGLVRVLYAGLTGRWPGPGDSPLDPAPRVGGRAVPPSELVGGIPRDLDRLCSMTAGEDAGPRSPGDLARYLAPWAPAEPLTDPGGLAIDGPHRPRPGDGKAAAVLTDEDLAGVLTDEDLADVLTDEDLAGVLTDEDLADDSQTDDPATDDGSSAPHTGSSSGGLTTGGHPVSHADGPDDWALLARSAPTTARPPESQPLGPFLPPAPVSRPPQDQARFVLAIVAGLVTVGLILAAFSLRGLFQINDPIVRPAPLIPTSTVSAGSNASSAGAAPQPFAPSESIAPSATLSPSSTPAEVSGIQAIDPQGDGDENGSTADRAIDSDPSTTWRSARYNTASFGGLKKGLGLYLMLGGNSARSITVTMSGTGGTVELRTAKGPGLDSSVVAATGTIVNGAVALTPPQPMASGSYLLWFTELPQQSNGEYRLVVSEITAS